MTPYIQQQLKKLCDNPNWYDDMLISWGKNPRNEREAIYNYLSHVQLKGLLENTQIVFAFIGGDMKPAFYFEIPRDTNRYLILGILEVPGHTKEYTEGFTEEMVIPYRTEELNPYLRYPNQEINNNHLHSEHIRLQIREILQIPLSDITIIDIIALP